MTCGNLTNRGLTPPIAKKFEDLQLWYASIIYSSSDCGSPAALKTWTALQLDNKLITVSQHVTESKTDIIDLSGQADACPTTISYFVFQSADYGLGFQSGCRKRASGPTPILVKPVPSSLTMNSPTPLSG